MFALAVRFPAAALRMGCRLRVRLLNMLLRGLRTGLLNVLLRLLHARLLDVLLLDMLLFDLLAPLHLLLLLDRTLVLYLLLLDALLVLLLLASLILDIPLLLNLLVALLLHLLILHIALLLDLLVLLVALLRHLLLISQLVVLLILDLLVVLLKLLVANLLVLDAVLLVLKLLVAQLLGLLVGDDATLLSLLKAALLLTWLSLLALDEASLLLLARLKPALLLLTLLQATLLRSLLSEAGAERLRRRMVRDEALLGHGLGRPAVVFREELLAISLGRTAIGDLGLHGREALLAIGRDLVGLGTRVPAARPVEADADVGVVARHVMDINVADDVHVHAIDLAVVVKIAPTPVAAVVADAGISKAVRNAAVEADVTAPEAMMEAIAAVVVAPVGRRPQSAAVRWRDPCARDPVIARVGVRPIAGGPLVARIGEHGLVINGKRRGRLIGVHSLGVECILPGVDLVVVLGVVGIVLVVDGAGRRSLIVVVGLVLLGGLAVGLVVSLTARGSGRPFDTLAKHPRRLSLRSRVADGRGSGKLLRRVGIDRRKVSCGGIASVGDGCRVLFAAAHPRGQA